MEISKLKAQKMVLESELNAKDRNIEQLQRKLNQLSPQAEMTELKKQLEEAQAKLAEWEHKWNLVVGEKKTYIIKEGDTLEKIAEDPTVYGDRNKWKLIFEANEGKIEDPNKLTPGAVIVIP